MAKARSRPGCTFLSRPLHSRQVALSLFIRPRAGRHVELQQQARASLAAIRRHSPLRNVTLSPLLRLVTLSLLRAETLSLSLRLVTDAAPVVRSCCCCFCHMGSAASFFGAITHRPVWRPGLTFVLSARKCGAKFQTSPEN